MSMTIDMRTVSLATGVTFLALAPSMTYVWLRRRTYPGFGSWTLSWWLGFLGMVMLAGRGMLPDAVSVWISNLLIVAAMGCVAIGFIQFTGGRPSWKGYGALLASVAALIAYLLWIHPSLRLRITVISFSLGWLCLRAAHAAWRRLPAVLAGTNPLIHSTLLGLSALYILRGVASLWVPPSTQDLMAPSQIQGLWLLMFLLGHTFVNIGLFVLNAQRVERDLQIAIEECKVLRGIIPICASCKKIRDDQGAWNQVEAYIHQHTEAEFTHGICPDCARVLLAHDP